MNHVITSVGIVKDTIDYFCGVSDALGVMGLDWGLELPQNVQVVLFLTYKPAGALRKIPTLHGPTSDFWETGVSSSA